MAMTAQNKTQAAAVGLSDEQIKKLEALNIDWSKLLAVFMQILPLILDLFKTPAPTPAPAQS